MTLGTYIIIITLILKYIVIAGIIGTIVNHLINKAIREYKPVKPANKLH